MGGEGDKKGIMRDIKGAVGVFFSSCSYLNVRMDAGTGGRGSYTFHRKSGHGCLAQQPTIRLNCRQLLSLALRDQIIGAADMDFFLSSDVLSQIGEEKSEVSDDDYGETALGDFDSFLLGKDDVDIICDRGQERDRELTMDLY